MRLPNHPHWLRPKNLVRLAVALWRLSKKIHSMPEFLVRTLVYSEDKGETLQLLPRLLIYINEHFLSWGSELDTQAGNRYR
jgi:hypothetical protein